MANEVKWKAPAAHAAIVNGVTINAGALALSSEIDNETNLRRWLALELTWTAGSAANPGEVYEARIIYKLDGTNYEDGDGTVESMKPPDAVFIDDGETGAQKQAVAGIPIGPFAFKVQLKNATSQNSGASAVTLDAETYDEDIQ